MKMIASFFMWLMWLLSVEKRANPTNFLLEAPAVLEGEIAGSHKRNYGEKNSTADTIHPSLSNAKFTMNSFGFSAV